MTSNVIGRFEDVQNDNRTPWTSGLSDDDNMSHIGNLQSGVELLRKEKNTHFFSSVKI